MKINIEKLALEAKIELSNEEAEEFKDEILKAMDRTKVLDELEGVVLIGDYEVKLREDKIEKSLNREDCLKNAPESENGFFMVPNIGGYNE